jgi:predicted MFS family arabinose efflux permease
VLSVLRLRGVAYLLSTSLIGRLPSGMALVALVRLVRDQGGSYGTASVLTSVYVLAGTAGQPLLGRAIDRTGRPRLVLLASAVVATLTLTGLAFWAVSIPALGLALSFASGFTAPPLEACLRSLWVGLMEPGRQLHQALSLDAAAQEIMFVCAPLISAVGIIAFGTQGNILFMAALGLLGAVLFTTHGLLASREVPAPPVEGHSSPIRSAWFRRLLVALVLAGTPIGVILITSAAFGESIGSPAFGAWALALNAAGGFTGAVLVARHPFAAPAHRVIRWVTASLALLYLPTAFGQAPPGLWLVFAYVGGLSLPPLLTQVFSHLAHTAPASQLNEANAWVLSALTVGISAGTLSAGLVINASRTVPAGVTWAVLMGSVLGLVGALVARPAALAPGDPLSTREPGRRPRPPVAS